jgi:acetyl-CoA carboxylase carboxyl transferase subunit beta
MSHEQNDAASAPDGAGGASSQGSDAQRPQGSRSAPEGGAGKRGAAAAGAGAQDAGGGVDPALSETRLGRFRFAKKKDMPGGLWLKCENCSQMIYRKELEEASRVCPSCSFHFTLPGRERIRMVLDEGSWNEYFADLTALDRLGFTDKIPYAEKVAIAAKRTGQNEALLCGTGAIDGRPVVLAVLDFGFLGGSMGEVVGEKFALACDLARQERYPLVCFTSSGGARMHEGAVSLMQMAKTCSALQTLGEAGGMSICVMTHPTTGGVTASFAAVCDLTLAEPGALIGFAGPRVIAATLKQELPAGFQRAEFLLEKGMLDAIVPRTAMRATLGRLLDYDPIARGVETLRPDHGTHTALAPTWAQGGWGRDNAQGRTEQSTHTRAPERGATAPAERAAPPSQS